MRLNATNYKILRKNYNKSIKTIAFFQNICIIVVDSYAIPNLLIFTKRKEIVILFLTISFFLLKIYITTDFIQCIKV